MDGMDNFWGIGYGYIWVIGLIVVAVILGVIVNAVKRRKIVNRPKYNSPHDILKIRYVKGEISKEEYDDKKRHIS